MPEKERKKLAREAISLNNDYHEFENGRRRWDANDKTGISHLRGEREDICDGWRYKSGRDGSFDGDNVRSGHRHMDGKSQHAYSKALALRQFGERENVCRRRLYKSILSNHVNRGGI